MIFFSYVYKFLNIYQLNIIKKVKKDYQKKLIKNIKIFLKKKNEKGDNMVMNITKISQEMKKKKKLVEYRKKYYRIRKNALL